MNVEIETIQKILEKHHRCIEDECQEYGEPGYNENPAKAILFANWNDIPCSTLDWLEHHGYALEWSDEWTVNWDGDRKAYRTSPDSYGWRSSLVYLDNGKMLAKNEITPNSTALDDYIAYLLDSHKHIDQFDVDWTQHGFTHMSEEGAFESGWHPGQTDNPKEILAKAKAEKPTWEFIFSLDKKSQFYITFSLWGRANADSVIDAVRAALS